MYGNYEWRGLTRRSHLLDPTKGSMAISRMRLTAASIKRSESATNVGQEGNERVKASGSNTSENGDPYRQFGCFISVITIVYNNRAGFDLTAKSVLEQADADFEWIIIDGGSTDGTVEAIRHVGGRVAFWCSEQDGGIYDAMNKGLQRASGQFVVFMNSGDAFATPDSLAKVSNALRGSDSDVAMVICSAEFRLSETRSYIQLPRHIDYISHSLPTSHQAMFFSTKLHRKIMFNTSFKVAGDYDAICRIYQASQKCIYLHDVIAVVCRGLDSNSLRFPFRNVAEMAKVQRRVLGLGWMYLLTSAARRLMPQLASRLLRYRWCGALTYRLIALLRPVVPVAHGLVGTGVSRPEPH